MDFKKYTDEYVTTIGIDYGVKTVKFDTEEVKINFWDIGGDPIYFDVRNEFYKDTQGALLVYDVTNRLTFQNLDTWINEMKVHSTSGDIVVFLVANKIDLVTSNNPGISRQVTVNEGKEYAQKIGAK